MSSVEFAVSARELVRRNVRAMMDWRGWTQAELADKIGQTQPWLSKRLSDETRFQIEDLDAIAAVFMVPVSSLLEPGGLAEYERRSGRDRRSQKDRRRTKDGRALSAGLAADRRQIEHE